MPRSVMPVLLLPFLLLSTACDEDELGQVFPSLGVEREIIDFGALPVLHKSTVERTVANQGLARLRIYRVEIVGRSASVFSSEGLPESLEISEEVLLSISFQPQEEAEYDAVLRIHSNDPVRPIIEIELIGRGENISAIDVDPPSIAFELVGEGMVAVESLRVYSVGTAPLIVEKVELEEGSAASLAPLGSWGGSETIEPGEFIELSLAYMPKVDEDGASGGILISSTDPNRRIVRVPVSASTNKAPVAVCGREERITRAPGDIVELDGSSSYDPDGHEPLSFEWTVARRPLASETELIGPDTENPSIELDVPGTWEILLTVVDSLGAESVAPCRKTIQAMAADRVFVELVWDHPVTDLDLHVIKDDGDIFGPLDCWWANPDAFGCMHSGDDLAGFGPEWVRLSEPDAGSYRVVVDFSKDNGAKEPETRATIRVYQYGVLHAEKHRTLEHSGIIWDVLVVEWPGGDVSSVDSIEVSR